MAKKNKKTKTSSNIIALNKKARHDYFIEQTLEAGLSLKGWEVKSLRDSQVQIKESYVILKNNEQQSQAINMINKMSNKVVTQVAKLNLFYPAENYHQNYFNNNSSQPYCQMLIAPKLAKYFSQ